jgi:hypothetical protein
MPTRSRKKKIPIAAKTGCKMENVSSPTRSAIVKDIIVDKGIEYSWIAANILDKPGIAREKKDLQFVMAN